MANTITQVDLAQARRIAKAATPGPWYAGDDYYGGPSLRTRDTDASNITGEGAIFENTGRGAGEAALEDVTFMAHFDPLFVLRLLDEIERMRGG